MSKDLQLAIGEVAKKPNNGSLIIVRKGKSQWGRSKGENKGEIAVGKEQGRNRSGEGTRD